MAFALELELDAFSFFLDLGCFDFMVFPLLTLGGGFRFLFLFLVFALDFDAEEPRFFAVDLFVVGFFVPGARIVKGAAEGAGGAPLTFSPRRLAPVL